MDEKKFIYIALFFSFVGILSLMLIVEKMDVSNSDINIALLEEGTLVKVKGQVESIRSFPELTLFDLKDSTGIIKVIVFNENLTLNKKDLVEVEGRTKIYKDYMEIEADLIRKF